MKILSDTEGLLPQNRRAALAIGMFDGVHLGHQQVLRQAIADARQHQGCSVAVTFDRHPNAVLDRRRLPPLIYSLSQKLRVLDELGLDAAWVLHFDAALSAMPPEAFIGKLLRRFGSLWSVSVGHKFAFGHKRAGNVDLLQALGQKWRFLVRPLAAVSLNGKMVSSTRIREAIAAGPLEEVSQMLGRPYSIAGPVIAGDRRGAQLGFPTANLDVAQLALPPAGVYAAYARARAGQYAAAVNIGFRPTLQSPGPRLQVEAHLLDFAGDLYGQEVELIFVQKLRPERAFPSLEALQEQIRRDVQSVRASLIACP